MIKRFLLIFPIAFSFMIVSAQRATYLGAEGAINLDVYDYVDNGSLIKHTYPSSGYFGLNIRQDINPGLFVEAGLLRKHYYEGIGFTTTNGYGSGNAIDAWLIPLRLGTRINISRKKIFLVPVVGFALGINTDYGYGDGGIGGSETTKTDTIIYNVNSKLNLTRTFPLLQTGIGIEFMFLRTALISVAANYYTGFKNVMTQNIEYTHNSASYTATAVSKGEIVSFGIACKYPVSNLWTHKKYRE